MLRGLVVGFGLTIGAAFVETSVLWVVCRYGGSVSRLGLKQLKPPFGIITSSIGRLTSFPHTIEQALALGVESVLLAIAGAPQVHNTFFRNRIEAPLEQGLPTRALLSCFDAPI